MLGMFLGDHLPLGKISDHHSPFNQFVSDEMRGLMQTVTALVALLFRDPPVDLREVNIPSRLLLAAVPLGADLVQLFVVPRMALLAADVIEAPLLVDPYRQGLDPQIKGHHLPRLWLGFGSFIDEGGVIVPAGIPTDRHLPKAAGRHLGERGQDIGEPLVLPLASRRQDQLSPLKAQVGGRVAEGEELVPRAAPGESQGSPPP